MQNECKRRKKNRVRPFSAKLTPRDSLSEAWKLDVETANNAPGLEAVCPPPSFLPPSFPPPPWLFGTLAMRAPGGVLSRKTALGWCGAVETVLGVCWDDLGTRSIEQQGRAGPFRAARRLQPHLGAGRSSRAPSPSRPPAAARPHQRLWAGAAGKGKEKEGKRAPRSLCLRSVRVFASPGWKKSVFRLQLLKSAPSGFSTPAAFLSFYVSGFCKPSPCPGTSAAPQCPHAASRWSSLRTFSIALTKDVRGAARSHEAISIADEFVWLRDETVGI